MTDLAAVAVRAGVSTSTASRVLTGSGPASAASRERVLAAAAALGYHPHPVARLLAQGRGARVLLAVRDRRESALADPYVTRAVAAMAAVADRAGLGVALRRLPLDCGPELDEIAADRGVAAVVLVGLDSTALPHRRFTAIAPDGFDVDSAAAIGALLRHLHRRGRRRVALVSGPRWLPSARPPRRAYGNFMREAGLPHRTVTGDHTAAGGRRAARRILRAWPDTDAIVAVTDATAIGVLDVLAAHGRRVPDDVAVTGFDDVPLAGALRPALTTAGHPVEQIAAAACRAALDGTGGARLFPSRPVLRRTA